MTTSVERTMIYATGLEKNEGYALWISAHVLRLRAAILSTCIVISLLSTYAVTRWQLVGYNRNCDGASTCTGLVNLAWCAHTVAMCTNCSWHNLSDVERKNSRRVLSNFRAINAFDVSQIEPQHMAASGRRCVYGGVCGVLFESTRHPKVNLSRIVFHGVQGSHGLGISANGSLVNIGEIGGVQQCDYMRNSAIYAAYMFLGCALLKAHVCASVWVALFVLLWNAWCYLIYVSLSITLFDWATREFIYGLVVCSVSFMCCAWHVCNGIRCVQASATHSLKSDLVMTDTMMRSAFSEEAEAGVGIELLHMSGNACPAITDTMHALGNTKSMDIYPVALRDTMGVMCVCWGTLIMFGVPLGFICIDEFFRRSLSICTGAVLGTFSGTIAVACTLSYMGHIDRALEMGVLASATFTRVVDRYSMGQAGIRACLCVLGLFTFCTAAVMYTRVCTTSYSHCMPHVFSTVRTPHPRVALPLSVGWRQRNTEISPWWLPYLWTYNLIAGTLVSWLMARSVRAMCRVAITLIILWAIDRGMWCVVGVTTATINEYTSAHWGELWSLYYAQCVWTLMYEALLSKREAYRQHICEFLVPHIHHVTLIVAIFINMTESAHDVLLMGMAHIVPILIHATIDVGISRRKY